MNNMQAIKAKLTAQQMIAADKFVENEFNKALGKGLTQDELAEEIGVTRKTLYNWAKIPEYNAYVAHMSDQRLASHRAMVDAQLIKAIRGGNNGVPSIRGIELYLKTQGRLTEKHEITTHDGKPQPTQAEIDAEVSAMMDKLQGGQ